MNFSDNPIPTLRHAWFTCLALFFLSRPIAALGDDRVQDPAVDLPPFVITGETSDEPLEVVLGTKSPVQPVPAQDGADFLKCVPGFGVIRKGGTDGDPILRGMAGSRLSVQLDGACSLGGCGNRMDPPTAYVFPAAYDRVTVVKGPQTVIYGSGNSAGIVRFETVVDRYAEAAVDGRASVTAGSWDRLDGAIDSRFGTPGFQARIGLTRTRSGDYRDGTGGAVHAAHKRWSANALAVWTPDEKTRCEFSAALSDGEAAYADRAMDGVKFDRNSYGFRIMRDDVAPAIASVELQVFRNYVDHVMDNYSLRPFVPTMMMPGRAVSNPDRLTLGGKAQMALRTGAGGRLTLGVDHQTNRHAVRSTGDETNAPYESMPRNRDADFKQSGIYAEFARPFFESGRVIAGARLDFWRAADLRASVPIGMMGGMPNPSAGHVRDSRLESAFARYEHRFASLPATAYVGIGRAARFPDYWELVKNEGMTSLSAFGTAPEKTTQLDVGLIHRRGRFDLTVSAFANEIRDFNLVQSAVAKPSGMMGTRLATVTRNVDASTFGGELGLGWRLADGWKADASVAWVRGTNRTDSLPLAQMPPLESRLSLAYVRPEWSVGGLVRAVAAQDRVAVNQGNIVGQDIGPSPGFAVASIHAAWSPRRFLRFSAGIDNVFDRAYAEHVSRAGSPVTGYTQDTRVNEPGRTLWARVDLTY